MANISQKYIDIAKKNYPNEPEFLQTVEEVLLSIEPVLEAHPEYEKAGLVKRLIEPERMIRSEFLGLMIMVKFRLTEDTECSSTAL